MRWLRLLVVVLPLATALPAAAEKRPWSGALRLELAGLPPLQTTGTGVATLNGSGGGLPLLNSLRLGTGAFALTTTVPNTLTIPIPSVEWSLAAGAGTFVGTSSAFGGRLPLPGTARFCVIVPGCALPVSLPLTSSGTRGLGIGGVIAVESQILSSPPATVRLALEGGSWTVGQTVFTVQRVTPNTPTTPMIVTFSATGFAHGPLSASGLVSVGQAGALQLVTPVVLRSGFFHGHDGFGTLELHFAPQPGRLAMLVAGATLLVLVASRRRRDQKGWSSRK